MTPPVRKVKMAAAMVAAVMILMVLATMLAAMGTRKDSRYSRSHGAGYPAPFCFNA